MEYATMLADGPARTPASRRCCANERTLIVPVVNVDGFVTTRADSAVDPSDNNPAGQDPNGPRSAESRRAARRHPRLPAQELRRRGPGPASVPCELQYGVDNNRNYGNLWGGPGSSQDPTSQSFHGPGPRSEPETQAVWNYAPHAPGHALITLHNVAALVLRPPGLHDGGLSPDEDRDEGARRRDGRRHRLHVGVRLPALRHRRHDRGRHLRGHRRLRLHDRDRARPAARSTSPTSTASSTSGTGDNDGAEQRRPARGAAHRRRGRGHAADHAVISGTLRRAPRCA